MVFCGKDQAQKFFSKKSCVAHDELKSSEDHEFVDTIKDF